MSVYKDTTVRTQGLLANGQSREGTASICCAPPPRQLKLPVAATIVTFCMMMMREKAVPPRGIYCNDSWSPAHFAGRFALLALLDAAAR